ncbi:uncharacterized protein LOC111811813 [Cucurbita pepo subsp. pepo]|uniref:uncharacterized protein LOC111811813 n=1 Tax=Cucurbita pepo subsp. pepo TaxID=3664 RepID=UPI000C9D4017|nr:uncharacterized protein LOC111811813 [Cucurbita pepo subsp. pepo]
MEDCLRESMRKLALWLTKTFKPIMTHDELEPIMVTLGFIALEPAVNGAGISWKSYKYSAADCRTKSVSPPPPIPRLPYPRIDGLHIYTYRAFLDAVNFYLEKFDISDLFHIRGLPLYRNHDRNRKWRRMDEEGGNFVYREGTLDQTTLNRYNFHKTWPNNKRYKKNESSTSTSDDENDDSSKKIEDPICIVSLKDVIT